jgi:hypothetical protein
MLGGSNPTVPQQTGNSARVADPAAPIREVAARAVAPQPAVRMARVGGGTVSGPSMIRPVAARSRRRGGQVQIESVDSRAGAMAMWSVPASDTAVIWLGDADPRARLPR